VQKFNLPYQEFFENGYFPNGETLVLLLWLQAYFTAFVFYLLPYEKPDASFQLAL
jgi:hypothetical protein